METSARIILFSRIIYPSHAIIQEPARAHALIQQLSHSSRIAEQIHVIISQIISVLEILSITIRLAIIKAVQIQVALQIVLLIKAL